MKPFKRFNKSILLFLILFTSVASFLTGLFTVLSFQSKYLLKDKIENAISEAERLTIFDKSITPERALKIFSGNLFFSIFNNDCTSFYSTDLRLHSESCQKRDPQFSWYLITTPRNNTYILGFSSQLNISEYLSTYHPVLITTIGTYILFIFVLTLVFFRVFIKNPINKITGAIDTLLRTKEFNIDTLNSNKSALLSNLYASVSMLLKEVVKLNREEEKLILSRQIAHDLRAPLSILENQFKESDSQSVEYLAFKRLKDITRELMPGHKSPEQKTFRFSSLLEELPLVYSQITFHINSGIKKEANQSWAISETDLYRFLANIIKNSIEASANNIYIEASHRNDFLEVSLQDDGEGMDSKKVEHVLDGYTSKIDGHGLGISSIKKKLQDVGGNVCIETSLKNGFKITLQIPFSTHIEKNFVLIDDDKLIRINWSMLARKKGMKLICFSSIDEFIQKASDVPLTSHIYVDSNLEGGIRGELESKRISDLGFSNIYLATSYNKSDFDLNTLIWVRDVISKTPPF